VVAQQSKQRERKREKENLKTGQEVLSKSPTEIRDREEDKDGRRRTQTSEEQSGHEELQQMR